MSRILTYLSRGKKAKERQAECSKTSEFKGFSFSLFSLTELLKQIVLPSICWRILSKELLLNPAFSPDLANHM